MSDIAVVEWVAIGVVGAILYVCGAGVAWRLLGAEFKACDCLSPPNSTPHESLWLTFMIPVFGLLVAWMDGFICQRHRWAVTVAHWPLLLVAWITVRLLRPIVRATYLTGRSLFRLGTGKTL